MTCSNEASKHLCLSDGDVRLVNMGTTSDSGAGHCC